MMMMLVFSCGATVKQLRESRQCESGLWNDWVLKRHPDEKGDGLKKIEKKSINHVRTRKQEADRLMAVCPSGKKILKKR